MDIRYWLVFLLRKVAESSMPKVVKKIELTQSELRAWELFNPPHNLTTKKIAEKMKKSASSVEKYLRSYRKKAKPEETDTTTIDRDKRLEEKAWQALEDSFSATKLYGKDATEHPDSAVRLNASIKYLQSHGHLISQEDKSINITTHVNVEKERKEKLKTGLNRFGYEIPEICNN